MPQPPRKKKCLRNRNCTNRENERVRRQNQTTEVGQAEDLIPEDISPEILEGAQDDKEKKEEGAQDEDFIPEDISTEILEVAHREVGAQDDKEKKEEGAQDEDLILEDISTEILEVAHREAGAQNDKEKKEEGAQDEDLILEDISTEILEVAHREAGAQDDKEKKEEGAQDEDLILEDISTEILEGAHQEEEAQDDKDKKEDISIEIPEGAHQIGQVHATRIEDSNATEIAGEHQEVENYHYQGQLDNSRDAEASQSLIERRNASRIGMAKLRATETPQQQEERRQYNRIRKQNSRANETPQQLEERRQSNQIRMQNSRSNETPQQLEERRQSNNIRNQNSRARETPQQQEERRQANRARMARLNSSEMHFQRVERLEHRRDTARNSRRQIWMDKKDSAFSYQPNIDYNSDPACNIGSAVVTCQFCEAKKWKGEAKGMCCSGGKVYLHPLITPPEPLRQLLEDDTAEAKHFRKNIRKYNNCFQMTSFGTTRQITEEGFMPTFKIQGQVYHRIGSLLPLPNEEPKFLQIYFTGDMEKQAEQRCRDAPLVRLTLVAELQEMLHNENTYVQSFKCALERNQNLTNFCISINADRVPSSEHRGRYNAPSTSEVAVIMAGEQYGKRDIIIEARNMIPKRISETHRSYDALQYPLMFWQGEDGYHFELKQRNPTTGEVSTRKISAMDFYAFRIMCRESNFNIILRCNDLFHQYVVDMYAKIEAERLRFIRLNQKKLRVEEYIHLRDALQNDGNVANTGQLIILPSSFTGGPRYMHERTQDAMTYVRTYGRPHLFITFTCNPNWLEINNELFVGQRPTDRHDLLARVFHQKLKNLMNLITKACIFGDVRCHMYTVEWQKRGLPHAHILIWLRESLHVDRVDQFISAEIPNPEEDQQLYSCVTSQMIHGPCGTVNPKSPCMKDGKCTKRYPKELLKETRTGTDGYPLYKRRKPEDGGYTAQIQFKNSNIEVDNRWVVPYCPLLSRIFNAHLNVEFCNSIKSIKYVCKYINKGSDMAVFDIITPDICNEVQQYELGRYISSNEAIWRMLDFSIHERYPAVIHLCVHLENGQRVYYTEENAVEQAQNPPSTTLTAFFQLCNEDDFAKNLFYHQVPKYYTWDTRNKKWNRRKVGQNSDEYPGMKTSDALGRVYTIHPQNSECFHLRLLLHVVKGPTSFQHLKTFEDNVCNTYKEACQLRGLLENDEHWNLTLEEAALSHSPIMLRELFAIMLQVCSISNPIQLWNIHKENLSEDILYEAQKQNQDMNIDFNEDIFNRSLIYIEDRLKLSGGPDLKSFGLPNPNRVLHHENMATEEMREKSYNLEELKDFLQENEDKMIPDQKHVFDTILQAISNDQGGMFFLDAPGGTGKTFLINLILAKIREKNEIALAVASSGIAATLLSGGRTAHSTFKLPLNMTLVDRPTCHIPRQSGTAKILQKCKLIVWDECTMSHKAAFEALNETLQDIKCNNEIMGGVTVLLAGDFRQTLPVIPRGTRCDELSACIKSSYLWSHIHTLELKTNMRVHLIGDPSIQQFSDLLLQLGNGCMKFENEQDYSLEQIGTVVKTANELLDIVFPDLADNFHNHAWLYQRAILAPQNDTVNKINHQLLSQIPGEVKIYASIDSVCDSNDAVNYPTEFLNALEIPGVPSHNLQLKIGAPIILLRNLNPPSLCNGTRLIVKALHNNVIEATILTGQGKGKDVFIPRIPIIPSDTPFQFKRLQFPVRPSFAMSINKAQGQSLEVVGLDLRNPCFSHGQLYVGCSRVGNPNNLFIFAPNGKTRNIVYQEALQ